MRRRVSSFQTKQRASAKALQFFLGVDVVEYQKAKLFYVRHKNRLEDFFHHSEISFIRKNRRPYKSLALLLAAKEAVFKSSGKPWMGTEGFRKIEILAKKRNRLEVRLKGDFKGSFSRRRPPSLSVLKSRRYVVAGCHSA